MEKDLSILGEDSPLQEIQTSTPARTGELEAQFKIAVASPRSVSKAILEAKSHISGDPGIAEAMWYTKRRGNTEITGPSIRLAELVAYSWRNIIVDGGVVQESQKSITAEGTVVDLERNSIFRVRVTRPIVDRTGRRYSEDLIQTVGQAAVSIAIRNAIFKVVPAAFTKQILQHAMDVSRGKESTLSERRAAMLDYFKKEQRVSEEEVLRFLGLQRVDDIGLDELLRLRGAANSIKDGESTPNAIFRDPWRQEAKAAAEDLTKGAEPAPRAPAKPPVEEARANILEIEARKSWGDNFEARWPHVEKLVEGLSKKKAETLLRALLSSPPSILDFALEEENPVEALRAIAAASSEATQEE